MNLSSSHCLTYAPLQLGVCPGSPVLRGTIDMRLRPMLPWAHGTVRFLLQFNVLYTTDVSPDSLSPLPTLREFSSL